MRQWPVPTLVKAVARGHARFEDLARREDVTPRYGLSLRELAFLPPKLVEAIIARIQPADMTAETLTLGERGLAWSADWAPRAA